MAKGKQNKNTSAATSKLKIISLGGLEEIGKNMTVLEYENDIIIIDCGMGFPDDEMPGVDFVIPDTTYLEKNAASSSRTDTRIISARCRMSCAICMFPFTPPV